MPGSGVGVCASRTMNATVRLRCCAGLHLEYAATIFSIRITPDVSTLQENISPIHQLATVNITNNPLETRINIEWNDT